MSLKKFGKKFCRDSCANRGRLKRILNKSLISKKWGKEIPQKFLKFKKNFKKCLEKIYELEKKFCTGP